MPESVFNIPESLFNFRRNPRSPSSGIGVQDQPKYAVYWQAREISRLATAPDFPVDPDLLRHVSPIEWKNVILYGEIKIDPAKLKMRRP